MKRLGVFAVCLLAVTGVGTLLMCAPSEPKGSRPRFAAAAGSPLTVGPLPHKILVADMNGDGNPDIVLTCGSLTQDKPDPQSGFVAAFWGDGRGAFQAAQPLIPIGAGGLKAAVGDLNNDRRFDIVVIGHDSYAATILLQDERGQFHADSKPTVQASTGDHPHTHDVALADVNGDGKLDLLTTNADDGNVSVLLGDGAAGFEPANGSPFAAGQHPYEGLTLGDLNDDDKLDVVVPNLLGRAVSVLLGDGVGGFAAAPGSPFAVGDRPGFVTLGDLTGDSKLDIVATHDDDAFVYVLRGDGRGVFQPTAGSPVKLNETVWGAGVADMNADGKNDLILGAKHGHVLIMLGDGAGGFDGDPVLVPVGGKGPYNIAVAHVDRDGKLDLVTSNGESGTASVLLQR
jgi:FG-GAP-like repeat